MISNSGWQAAYTGVWEISIAHHSLSYWINDGLMTVFFLLIGLELEREAYIGELSNVNRALLPVIAAVGGMIIPATIYLMLNTGTATASGAGIPMATDIAFAIGVLSLHGSRVPASLKVFLTALAVIDDLGAIVVIAVFYSHGLVVTYLAAAIGVFLALLLLNRLKVRNLIPYLLGGVVMWYFMSESGVHTTIAGVLLAFAIPFGNGDERSTSYVLQHALHKPVSYVILPLFALANTSIIMGGFQWEAWIKSPAVLGIIAGLVLGKPLGIFLFTWVATQARSIHLPRKLNWKHILGVSFLSGIGFTMSIFITLIAFDAPGLINESKMAILTASTLSALAGYLFLNKALREAI